MYLPILYHDDQLVAIHKPAGLLVHQTNLDKGEDQDAMRLLRDQLDQWVYPIHRLDKATSGVLLFGLDSQVAATMVQQFTERKVEKRYLAVVRGYTKEKELIDYPLTPLWDKRSGKRSKVPKPAQEAQTWYQRIKITELPHAVGRYETARYSLLSLQPLTGRSRQLRRHMKHIFHPILGDKKHGDSKHNAFMEELTGSNRLMLHAFTLEILHPQSEERILITAEPSEEFQEVLRKLALNPKEGP